MSVGSLALVHYANAIQADDSCMLLFMPVSVDSLIGFGSLNVNAIQADDGCMLLFMPVLVGSLALVY